MVDAGFGSFAAHNSRSRTTGFKHAILVSESTRRSASFSRLGRNIESNTNIGGQICSVVGRAENHPVDIGECCAHRFVQWANKAIVLRRQRENLQLFDLSNVAEMLQLSSGGDIDSDHAAVGGHTDLWLGAGMGAGPRQCGS